MALHDELRGDNAPTGDYPFLDVADPEQGMLRDRIPPFLPDGPLPDLAGLTRIARDVITADTHKVISVLREGNSRPTHVAVFTGIHINGPGGTEYVEPGACYLDVGHRRAGDRPDRRLIRRFSPARSSRSPPAQPGVQPPGVPDASGDCANTEPRGGAHGEA